MIFSNKSDWSMLTCLHYQFFQPVQLGTYYAWEQTFQTEQIIPFNKELSNNKLLRNFFHMTGAHRQIGISLSLYAYMLQFMITKSDFPADAVAQEL